MSAAQKNKHEKQAAMLGMPRGTATGRLRKLIMFNLVCRLGLNQCFQCGKTIGEIDEFSIEHKEPWQLAADPVTAFFDLDNIAFSHCSCNYSAATKPTKKYASRKEGQRHLNSLRSNAARRAAYDPKYRREHYLRTGH